MSPNKKSILIGLVRCIGTRHEMEQKEVVEQQQRQNYPLPHHSTCSRSLHLLFIIVCVAGCCNRNQSFHDERTRTLTTPRCMIYIVIASVAVILFHFLSQPPLLSFPVNNTSIKHFSFVMALYQWWCCRYDSKTDMGEAPVWMNERTEGECK